MATYTQRISRCVHFFDFRHPCSARVASGNAMQDLIPWMTSRYDFVLESPVEIVPDPLLAE